VCCFAVVERAENQGGQGGQAQFMTNGPGREIYQMARTSNGLTVVAKSRKDSRRTVWSCCKRKKREILPNKLHKWLKTTNEKERLYPKSND
jgi:hypothetical protein